MPAIIAGIVLLIAFVREGIDLLRQPKYRSLVIWVGIMLLIGTVFYRNVEDWSWLDSLYFSVVTLATVGYGDLSPTTEFGKAFTIIYVLLGLGMIATFASMLARDRLNIADNRHDLKSPDGDKEA